MDFVVSSSLVVHIILYYINQFKSYYLFILSATVLTCPIELVMLQQQKYGGSFINSLERVTTRYGFGQRGWSRGLLPTIGRDTICVVGMLGITPIVQDYLMSKHNYSLEQASILASVVGGIFASIPSHPFDTIKTCMQGDMKQRTYTTFSKSASSLFKEVKIK